MIVIVEGPRGSGKTTLCKEVDRILKLNKIDSELYKAVRSESDDPNMSPYVGMRLAFEKQFKEPNKVFIWDRCHLTEYVMSAYLDRVPLDELVRRTIELDRLLQQNGARCFYLSCDLDIIDERVKARTDGRDHDMPLNFVEGLWNMAIKLSDIVQVVKNNDEVQNVLAVSKIVESVISQVPYGIT